MKTKQTLLMALMVSVIWAAAAKSGHPEDPLDLGSAGDFVILAKTGISTVPSADIEGDMGVSPIDHTAITGFSLVPSDAGTEYSESAQVEGKIYAFNYLDPTPTKMTTAISDMEKAFTDAAGRDIPDTTELGSGNISGLTINPGLHKWGTGVDINADVTLDALGNADAIFIFQIEGDLILANGQSVILAGRAQAKNIFWQVKGGAGAIIGTTAHFEGVILTETAITLQTGASFNGKLLAQTRVNLDQNKIVDSNLIPPPQVELEIVSEHGEGSPPVGDYINDYGVTLSNAVTGIETIGGTQYVNIGWTMTGNEPIDGLTTNMVMTHTNDAVLTWQWSTNYLLTALADPPDGGVIAGSANEFYPRGALVTVTAVAESGYHFTGWTGDVSGPTNEALQEMVMDQARTLTAHFMRDAVTLEIVSEHGAGLPPVGLYTNAYGTTLTNRVSNMETLGGTQYVNIGWAMTGNEPIAGLTTNMVMVHTNDAVLTWQWHTNYLLNASAEPPDGGAIDGHANGYYAAGTMVTVTAASASGYHFTGWTGDITGQATNATQTMTMDQARAMVAHFAHDPVILEIVSEYGVGTPPVGLYTNAYGTTLTNRATSVETIGGTQYVNIGWTMTGNDPVWGNTTNMVMVHTNDAVLTWQWSTNILFLLNAAAGPGGDVTGGTNGFYAPDTIVIVTAQPALGYYFTGWTGDVSDPTNNATQNLVMDQSRTLTAHFLRDAVALEIVSEHGVGAPPVGVYTNAYGTTLTNRITSTETLGGTQYVNIGWTMTGGNDPVSGSETNMVMVHTNDAVLTWQWGTNYLLNASAEPSGGGIITGSANEFYPRGALVSVTAVAAPGYHFTGWTGDVSGPTNEALQEMVMDQARTLTAHFRRDAVTLEIVSEHGVGTPPVGLYTNAYGTTLTNRVTGMETIGGTQYVNIGWIKIGGEPRSGLSTNMVMVQTNDAVLIWQWRTNYLLNTSYEPPGGGAITGHANGYYVAGTTVTVTATASIGSEFVGWQGDVSGPTNAAMQTMTMDQARTMVAIFALSDPPCGTPVTEGAFMELDLSAWFSDPEGVVGYGATTTRPEVMSATITADRQFLRLAALAPGITVVAVTATNANLSVDFHSFPVQVVGHPRVLSNTFTAHEPWNPRFEQRIEVLNDTAIACPAIGLRLLFSNLQPGITIENQTGTAPAPDGRPMIEWAVLFPDGDTRELSVMYLSTGEFRPDQYPPTVEIQYILPNAPLAPDPVGPPIIESVRVLRDGRVVLEFASTAGVSYAIDYMNDFPAGAWVTVPLTLQAGGNRVQWIDYGPPATFPAPALIPTRLYRVRQVAP